MELGKRIYSYRTKRNMSQGDLADALEVSRQSVSKWENGNATPDLDKLVKMSKLFGVTLDELVSGEESSPALQKVPAQSQRRFSRRQKVGIGFWCFYVLMVLAMAMSGEGLSGMLPGLPFLICGWLCYGTKLKHIVLWCTWVFALPAIAIPWYELIRLTEARLIMLFLWGSMLLFTLWALRHEPVPLSKGVKKFLVLGYGVWFCYITMVILRQFGIPFPLFPRDSTLTYWIHAAAYLLFISLLSVTTRLLRQFKQ